jgi:hypothetical protein
MRVLLIVTLDSEAANELIRSGAIGPKLQQLMTDLKPEAAYFVPNGKRTMHLIVNLQDASQMVTYLEPLWQVTKADIQVLPVMVQEDLQKGMQALPEVLSKYLS